MAMKYKTVGGTAPSGSLGDDFTKFLQSGLQTGSFGSAGATSQAGAANPFGSTAGIAGILNDLLAGGAGKIGGSMADMISRKQEQNVDALRSRYTTGGGTSFGTPAAFAESSYRATEAPELVNAIGNLQQSALGPLLQMIMGIAQKQTPQATTVGVQNPWVQGFDLLGQALGDVAQFVPFTNPVKAPPSSAGPVNSSMSSDYSSMFQLPQSMKTLPMQYTWGGH